MAGYDAGQILEGIEHAITAQPPDRPAAMPGDTWLLRSALQKSIRRGEAGRAQQAATALWQTDRKVFWKRLHTIALEDIGAASLDAVIQTLTAVSASSWRRRVGDERVALHLTRLLCGAVKNRMGDEILILAERDPAYKSFRERLAKVDDGLLADYAAHEASPLIERVLSLWYLAGMKKFPSDVMSGRTGNPEKAVQVLRDLDAPAALVEACIGVMGRTAWPLSIFLPLIWQATRKQARTLFIAYDQIPNVPEVEGIPVYAADIFTRLGQTSIRQLQKAVPPLRGFSVRQVGLALFYLEGGMVDKRLTSPALEEFRQQGETTDVESAGLCLPSYLGLRECLAANMPLLHDLRCQQLRRHLEGGE